MRRVVSGMTKQKQETNLCQSCTNWKAGKCLHYDARIASADKPICYCDGYKKKEKEKAC